MSCSAARWSAYPLTCARRLVVVVGSERALRIAASNARQVERHGALRERLREALGG